MKPVLQYANILPVEFKNPKEIKMSSGFKELFDNITWELMNFKECFDNSAKLCLSKHNVDYCIGIADAIIPVEHAWIHKEGKFYDPTWEKFADLGSDYLLIQTFNRIELLEFLELTDGVPPELWSMKRHGLI